jgi:predicted dehydrogenase
LRRIGGKVVFVDIKKISRQDRKRFSKGWKFIHDDGSPKIVKKIRNRIGDSNIVYLAIPPDRYAAAVRKYLSVAKIFVLEKPWARSVSELNKIRRLAKDRIIGVDHYLWKPEVRGFLSVHAGNPRAIQVTLCEDRLPTLKREHFWLSGIILDMLPHALSLISAAFPDTKLSPTKVVTRTCNHKKMAKARSLHGTKPNFSDETFARIDLGAASVVLGMGVKVKPVKYLKERLESSKFLQADQFFVDMSNGQYYINGSKFTPRGDEYRDILAALAKEEFERFAGPQQMERQVRLLETVESMKTRSADHPAGADISRL